MMKSAGVVNTNVVTFNAFSPQTRQRLHEARKASAKNRDKIKTSARNDNEIIIPSATPELKENESDGADKSVLTVRTSDTDMKSAICDTDLKSKTPRTDTDSATPKSDTDLKSTKARYDTNLKSSHKRTSQQRSSSHSLIPAAPSSRPSSAAQRLATKTPVDAAVEDNDGQSVKQEEDPEMVTQSEVQQSLFSMSLFLCIGLISVCHP